MGWRAGHAADGDYAEPVKREGGIDSAQVRRENASRVVSRVAAGGASSRASIAEETGLSRSTLTNIVSLLVGRGVLREGAAVSSASGRPRTLVELDPQGPRVACAEVDGSRVRVALADLTGRILGEAQSPTVDTDPRAVIRLVDRLLSEVASACGAPVVLVVAVSGPVAGTPARVVLSTDLGWRDEVDLCSVLEASHPGTVVLVENNATAAAVYQARTLPEMAGSPSLLGFHVDPGIGCGIVLGGEVFRAPVAFGSEAGHMWGGEAGVAECGCGISDCLSSIAGPEAMVSRYAPAAALPLDTALDCLTADVAAGVSQAVAAVEACAPALAHVINSVRVVVGPVPVVLGGFWEQVGSVLLPAVRERLQVVGARPEPDLLLGTGGDRAVLAGGLLLATDAFLADPLGLSEGRPPT